MRKKFRAVRTAPVFCSLLFLTVAAKTSAQTPKAISDDARSADAPALTLKTTVRRVVLDVVVTDAQGNPVPGLTKEDFAIAEDGQPQTALSFEASGFNQGMEYLPPKLPAQPVNTFVNLPATPEKGPLYVLLYDLVNMDNEDQMDGTANQHNDQIRGRQQLVKFIQSKPEGARFAIFVWSDALYLVQGFTSDKAQLFAAIDPSTSRPHLPKIFLMGQNTGRANVGDALSVVNRIGGYLDGLPGRKNLIWFSGGFPLALYPGKDDPPSFIDDTRRTLDLLARNQIAIYPVDVRGVVVENWRAQGGLPDDKAPQSDRQKGSPAAAAGADSGSQATAAKSAHSGIGQSLLTASYGAMDEIARVTGGRAFYSNNDVSAALTAATETGSSYYTLSYSPPPGRDTTRRRSIHVELAKKGYRLDYRRSYYGADAGQPAPAMMRASTEVPKSSLRDGNDTLDAYMKHGAPIAHQLIFAAHVQPAGKPAKGTPEQMTQIAHYLNASRKNAKTPAPIPLQRFTVVYTVMAHQLHLQESHASMNLQLATAAFDADGVMLNSVVDNASGNTSGDDPTGSAVPSGAPAKLYRAEQQIDVPLTAASIRVAVQDANTGRLGVMEIKLPLLPEDQSAGAVKAP